MDENRLKEILDLHKKWLNGEKGGKRADLHSSDLHGSDLHGSDLHGSDLSRSDLRRSDLQDSDLSYTDLSYSDLRGADLSRSNLHEANLDFSAWPLWCGSLKAYVDDRIAIQLLYHTLSVVQHSPHVSDELKRALLTPGNIDAANRFHRVEECGELEVYGNGNTF